MLPRPVRPVLKELVHVSPEVLKVFGGQVSHMLLQLVNRDQLTVGRDARVLVHTPQHTSCQANILAGRAAELLDGATLLLVLVPARGLAGSVAVVGKLALSAAVQIGLMAEAAVAHLGGQTVKDHSCKAGLGEDHFPRVELFGGP